MAYIEDRFKMLNSAVAEGLNRVAGVIKPVKAKSDLDIYNGLKPEDFGSLVQKFGEEATLKYIREMEATRQRS